MTRPIFPMLAVLLCALAPLASAQQKDGFIRGIFESQFNPEQRAAFGKKPELKTLVSAMTPEQRTASRSRLSEAEAMAESAEVLKEIARGYLLLDDAQPGAGENAVRLAGRLQMIEPEKSDGFTLAASGHFQMGDYPSAAEAAKEALKRDPDDAIAQTVLSLSEGRTASNKPPGSTPRLAPMAQIDGVAGGRPDDSDYPYKPRVDIRASKAPPAVASLLSRDQNPTSVPRDVPMPVLAALRKSKTGAEILDFILTHDVAFSRKQDLPPNVVAAYDPKGRVIFLSQYPEKPAIEIAVSIAHEGFHAIQVVRDKMEACLEAEQDATFMDRVVYHEMIHNGVPRLPSNHFIDANYSRFASQMRKGDIDAFNTDIARIYQENRKAVLERMVKDLPEIIRPGVKLGASVIDVPMINNLETIPSQMMNPFNINRWPGLYRTGKRHGEQADWERSWLSRHRAEFQGAP